MERETFIEWGKQEAQRCVHGQPPFCTDACPFELDVRNFAARLSRGRTDAAYRIFRDAVAFPGIVAELCPAPCQSACIRCKTDEAIQLHELERAVMAHAGNTAPSRFNLPKKSGHIAIVGGGISGLACALRLANLQYDVTVYEKTDRLGGHLIGIVPDTVLQNDIETQFRFAEYKLRLNTEIKDLSELDADIVYVATGTAGFDFGLIHQADDMLAQPKANVLVGGSMTGVDSIHALAQGLWAARVIDHYFQTGTLSVSPDKKKSTCLHVDERKLQATPAIKAQGNVLSAPEMSEEARRCLLCDCDVCQRTCDLMGYYGKFPGRIVDEVDATIHPSAIFANRMATRLIGSCTKCGICKESCPEHIDMQTFLLESRREMERMGDFPKAWSAFWLSDMEHAAGQRAALAILSEGKTTAKYAFFPGCQLGASDPRYVELTYKALLQSQPDTGLILNCCGAPAYWAGQEQRHEEHLQMIRNSWQSMGEPTLLLACPTCKKLLGQFLPEIDTEFVYSKLTEGEALGKGETVSVFDPCSSRHEPAVWEAVRTLITRCDYTLSPLSDEKENAQCCGYGGQTMIANPAKAVQVAKNRINQTEYPYVTYCTNCRDTFAAQGKRSMHVLDALFGLDDGMRQPPTWTKRRENREDLKNTMLALLHKEPEEKQKSPVKVVISDSLMEKMQKEYVLKEDVEQAISYCERTGLKLNDVQSGHSLGHLRIGTTTFWVEYGADGEGFTLYDVYTHRMQIQEADLHKAI